MNPIARYLHLKNFYWYNLAFWSILLILDLLRTFTFSTTFNFDFGFDHLIRWPLSVFLPYWMLSPLIFRTFMFALIKGRASFLIIHLMAGIVFGILHKVLSSTMAILLERLILGVELFDWRTTTQYWFTTYYDVFTGAALYWVIILILTGLGYYRRFREQYMSLIDARKDLDDAQLKTMKMQLHPHFLFNAFNTIVMMVRREKNADAVRMLTGLSDMLRMSLTRESEQFVTLREEIALLKKYLMIELVRYKDRLQIHWDIDEDCLDLPVPGFVLQPIVENAFKHGISRNIGPSEIRISVKSGSGLLNLSVFNSGSTWNQDWPVHSATGIGLNNTIDRLTKLYQGKSRFLVEQHDNGVEVKIQLPATLTSDDDA